MSRDETYLNAILTGDTSNLPTPVSRVDEYLYQIAITGSGGTITADVQPITDEEINSLFD